MDEQALISEYTPLVKQISWQMLRKLPPHIPFKEIYHYGMVGLFKATRSYKQEKGASFRTYAGIRIKGEIMDETRAMSALPRYSHEKYAQVAFVESACEDIEQSIALRDPCEQLELQQIEQAVSHVVERLPERKAKVFELYQKGLAHQEIGALFGVSEARSSQLLTQATSAIRAHLTARNLA